MAEEQKAAELPNTLDDDWDFDDFDDLEKIPCNCTYVSVCIFLPALNGALNAFVWPAYALHFEDMGWSLVSAGLCVTLGFVVRMTTQQMQLYAGYWLIVPLSAIHLAFAVIGFIFPTEEWAVWAQIIAVQGIDPTCAVEGIAFDSFGGSEVQARQATSTVLSVFTIAIAMSCTIGGILYDFAGWRGIGLYHVICEGTLLVILCINPACINSFKQVFFPSTEDKEMDEQEKEAEEGKDPPEKEFVAVLPQPQETLPAEALPGAVEEPPETTEGAEALPPGGDATAAVEEPPKATEVAEVAQVAVRDLKVEEADAPEVDEIKDAKPRATHMNHRASALSARKTAMVSRKTARTTQHSEKSSMSDVSDDEHRLPRLTIANRGRATNWTSGTGRTGRSAPRMTGRTNATGASGKTVLTALSRITNLSTAGQDFRHHFGTSAALQPQIVGATGAQSVMRDDVVALDEDGDVLDREAPTKGAKIPKDVRLPAFLIVMCCFLNTGSYVMEFATFAIYFKQVHNWNDATFASMAQTAGDVFAAIMMQVIPALFSFDYDPDELNSCKRTLHYLFSQPYNLTVVVFTWALWNLGMTSPVLVVAVIAQVFMGTTYVYTSKWATDMNLFYSLGDSHVFLTMQVYCRTAESFGGCFGSMLGTYLFTLNPAAPFAFGAAWAGLVFIIYTTGFCYRLGFGDEIENAEEKRSRRKGIKRVSSWAAGDRKSTKSKKSKVGD